MRFYIKTKPKVGLFNFVGVVLIKWIPPNPHHLILSYGQRGFSWFWHFCFKLNVFLWLYLQNYNSTGFMYVFQFGPIFQAENQQLDIPECFKTKSQLISSHMVCLILLHYLYSAIYRGFDGYICIWWRGSSFQKSVQEGSNKLDFALLSVSSKRQCLLSSCIRAPGFT